MTTTINWTNISSFSDLPSQANTVSGGFFWAGMLEMIWVILLLGMIVYGWETALLVSSFLCLILGLLGVYAGIISWTITLQFVGLILFTFLYIAWTSYKIKV